MMARDQPTKPGGRWFKAEGSAWRPGEGQRGSCADPVAPACNGLAGAAGGGGGSSRDVESRAGVWILFQVFWAATGAL